MMLAQQDVADSIGITRQYYALIEAGERQKKMDITLVSDLAKHFGLPISTIIKMEQESDITM